MKNFLLYAFIVGVIFIGLVFGPVKVFGSSSTRTGETYIDFSAKEKEDILNCAKDWDNRGMYSYEGALKECSEEALTRRKHGL